MPDQNCPVNSGRAIPETALTLLEESDPETAERALTLLEESDPQLVETVREALKNRREPMSLLRLHPSFWTRKKGFATWQLLRRKPEYRDAEVFRSRDSAVFTESFYSRFYKNYPPDPNESFPRWSARTVQQARSPKSLSGRERESILSPGFLPDTLRLPERWPPVPPEIDFPHPYVLERLTSSTIGVAVVTVSFPGLKEIQVDGKRFWADLNFLFDDICKDIFGYFGLEGWRDDKRENLTRAQTRERRRVERLVKTQLANSLRHRKRNVDPSRFARALQAYDMKKSGATYRKIAETPKQTTGGKKLTRAAIDRAKKDVRYKKHLIKVSFSR
jgi:hypothetical protein